MPDFPTTLNRVFSLSAVTALVFAAIAISPAQRPAGVKRPAPVPEGYLITPFGYFHPSCVKQAAAGDVLREDEAAVQHADGSFDSIHVCAFSRYTAAGERIAADSPANGTPSIGHSWIEAEEIKTATSSYGELTANWTVPAAPSAHDGQTIYFFPGMEDYKDSVTIIQPVLGWNSDFGSSWGIASWNCCVKGTVYESSPVRVKSGDVLFGKMKDTCSAGTLSCGSWNITTQDVTSGKSTTLSKTSSHKQTFNWAFAGALEVYNVARCSDYPAHGSLAFSNLALYNDKFVKISGPAWTLSKYSTGLTPQCSYGGSKSGTHVTLTY